MGIFMKFKCWGCDEIPCTCTKVELTSDTGGLEKETTTNPVLNIGDIAVKDGADWTVVEIQDGIAIASKVTSLPEAEFKRILPPYRKLVPYFKHKIK